MTKRQYRDYILSIKHLINVSGICREIGVSRQALTVFLNGYDGAVSIDILDAFVLTVQNLSKN